MAATTRECSIPRYRLDEIVTCPLTSLIRDHIKELNSARPKQPFFFFKPTTTLLLPGEGPVIRPKGVDLHYEVELALIIGKKIKDLSPDDEQGALDAIDSESIIDLTTTFSLPLAPPASPRFNHTLTQDIKATRCPST